MNIAGTAVRLRTSPALRHGDGMAELHVERKEPNIWPWIVGALLLAIVLWFVFMRPAPRHMTSANPADSMHTQPGMGTSANPMMPGTP